MKRLCPFEGYFIISMPGHTVPVRRAGAIVAIRARQAAVSTVIQVATAPRGVHARRTGRIERSHTPLHCSKNNRLVAMVNHRHKQEKSSTGVSGGYTPSMCLRHICAAERAFLALRFNVCFHLLAPLCSSLLGVHNTRTSHNKQFCDGSPAIR